MNKTLTALVIAGAVALGACSDGKPSARADVLTVVREDGKTNTTTVTKYFDFDRDGNVDARLRGKPSHGANSTDYLPWTFRMARTSCSGLGAEWKRHHVFDAIRNNYASDSEHGRYDACAA